MPNLTFTGCTIRHFDVRRDEGGLFTRVHLTANYSQAVISAMQWSEIADGIESAKLEGSLEAVNFVLTPKDKELAKHEIEISAVRVSDFQVFRVSEDGEGKRTELRFTIRSNMADAAALLESYMRRVGDAAASLKLNYSRQESLPLGEQGDDGAVAKAVVEAAG